MNIYDVNWSDFVNNAQSHYTTHWAPTVDEHFLDHLLPVLSSIPLVWEDNAFLKQSQISSTKTFANIPEVLDTPNGPFSGEDAKRMLGFLYYMPRGKLIKGTQVKTPRLGAFTPLAMYAHKLHHNVKYSSWDVKDKYFKFFLGKFLEPLINVRTVPLTIPLLDTNDIVNNRKAALTYKSGPKTGSMGKLTEYKCNIDHLEVGEFEDSEDYTNGVAEFPLPKIAIQMVLQTWLANVQVRDPSSMILDPVNWDRVPDALDAKVAEEKSPWEEKEDLPWT